MNKTLLLVIASIGAWAIFVMVSGLGVHLFGLSWDFQAVAELGEAFGVLGAVMAGVAVYFTWQALADQRAETSRLRGREIARDAAEAQRDEAREARIDEERLRDKELTFFRMLDLRREILNDAQMGETRGILVFRSLFNIYRNLSRAEEFAEKYHKIQKEYSYFLDHYFRFTYHILKFLNDNFSFERAYLYVRVLRAQLSSAEQRMIAMNAIFGAGRDKMLPLINKYGLLHNMSADDREIFLGLNLGLEEGAFSSHASEV